nr:hypothetical protein [Tanacetum cinerariifolium]
MLKKCHETYGSTIHTTTEHNDTEWFRRGEALQAKKDESSNDTRLKTPTKSKISVAEAAKVAQVSELHSLKERSTALEAKKITLEGQVTALESATAIKDDELAYGGQEAWIKLLIQVNSHTHKLRVQLCYTITKYLDLSMLDCLILFFEKFITRHDHEVQSMCPLAKTPDQ